MKPIKALFWVIWTLLIIATVLTLIFDLPIIIIQLGTFAMFFVAFIKELVETIDHDEKGEKIECGFSSIRAMFVFIMAMATFCNMIMSSAQSGTLTIFILMLMMVLYFLTMNIEIRLIEPIVESEVYTEKKFNDLFEIAEEWKKEAVELREKLEVQKAIKKMVKRVNKKNQNKHGKRK